LPFLFKNLKVDRTSVNAIEERLARWKRGWRHRRHDSGDMWAFTRQTTNLTARCQVRGDFRRFDAQSIRAFA